MSQLSRQLAMHGAKAMAMGIAITGIGATSGAVIENMGNKYYDPSYLTEAELNAATMDAEREATERYYTQQTVGEACMKLIAPYRPGGQLHEQGVGIDDMIRARVVEDEILSDILRNPDTSCGDNATDVRISTRMIMGSDREFDYQQTRKLRAEEKLVTDRRAEATDIRDEDVRDGLIAGAWTGSAGAILFFAASAGEAISDYRRTRRHEAATVSS